MGDFIGGIFGSDEEEVAPQNITTESTLTPEQRKLFNETLLPYLQSGDIGTMRDSPAPIGTTGRTQLGSDSLARLEALARNNPSSETAANSRTALNEILTRDPTNTEAFYKTNVYDPMLRDYERDTAPRIARTFGGNSMFSSERQQADRDSRDDLTRNLIASRESLALKGREQDTNAILGALDRTQEVETLEPSVLTAILGAGEIVRNQDNQKLAATRDEELRQRGEKDKRIAQILAALGIQGQENIVQPAIYSGGQEGIGGQAALMALAMGMGGGFGGK